MGRPSKLTDQQWQEIAAQLLQGQSRRAIAKAYGIAESTIRERLSAQIAETKAVAKQIYETKQLVKSLPLSAQIAAQTMADEMLAISVNLASAGKHGAIVSRTSMDLAARHARKINQDDPLASADILQGVAALTRIANESSVIGRDLLKTAKDDRKAPDDIVIDRSYG